MRNSQITFRVSTEMKFALEKLGIEHSRSVADVVIALVSEGLRERGVPAGEALRIPKTVTE
jgi:hypothetical protein